MASSGWTYAQMAFALLLGGLGAAAHLLVVRLRVGLLARRGPAALRATFPLGLIGPAAATLVAIRCCPRTAWLVPLGMLGLRWLVLGRRRPLARGERP